MRRLLRRDVLAPDEREAAVRFYRFVNEAHVFDRRGEGVGGARIVCDVFLCERALAAVFEPLVRDLGFVKK